VSSYVAPPCSWNSLQRGRGPQPHYTLHCQFLFVVCKKIWVRTCPLQACFCSSHFWLWLRIGQISTVIIGAQNIFSARFRPLQAVRRPQLLMLRGHNSTGSRPQNIQVNTPCAEKATGSILEINLDRFSIFM